MNGELSKFSRPQVTIDLEEYNSLKEMESRVMENGLTEDELSRVIYLLMKGAMNHTKQYLTNEAIRSILGIEVRVSSDMHNEESVKITFKKIKQ